MRSLLQKIISVILFSASIAVHAENISSRVVQATAVGPFAIGIGSQLDVNSHQSIFLGQLLNHDGSLNSLMSVSPDDATVTYAAASMLSEALPTGMQNVLKLYAQQGGTCTGYALDDFLLQSHFSGFDGNGALATDASTEEGRTGLLADAINEYYLVLQHRFSILGILNSYGKKYQFACRKSMFKDVKEAQAFIAESTSSGLPVLISFNIGPKMTDGPFKLQRSNMPTPEDVRLWLPRKTGERNSGGHSIVIAGNFTIKDGNYAVVLDSDWDYPRVWDLNEALGPRTAIEEIEFYNCK